MQLKLKLVFSCVHVCVLCVYLFVYVVSFMEISTVWYIIYILLLLVLVRANARAILARSLQVADIQIDGMDY